MIVVWLFLTVPKVCLQIVIVVFPDHIQIFSKGQENKIYTIVLGRKTSTATTQSQSPAVVK